MPGPKVTDDNMDTNEQRTSEQTQEDFCRRKRDEEEDDRFATLLKPYSTFLVRYPYVVVVVTVIILILSIVLSIVKATGASGLPDFSDPVKGYQAKGTVLSRRNVSHYNLREAVKTQKRTRRSSPGMPFQMYMMNLKHYVGDLTIFYNTVNGDNLYKHMSAVCQWYNNKITTQSNYSLFVTNIYSVHSIPNYIILLSNATDCESITNSNVNDFVSLLTTCVGYYKNGTLLDCMQSTDGSVCPTISQKCRSQKNLPNYHDMATLLYNVFHYLGDLTLQDNPSFLKLTASVTVMNGNKWNTRVQLLFKPIYDSTLTKLEDTQYKGIKVAGYRMSGLKFNVFKTQMILQSALLVIAIVIVIFLTWFFSGSFFLGLMTLGCIIMAMIIAFFVYSRIFALEFFPFLNMTVLIFIIGIGADDVFVYTGIWQEAKYIYKIQNVHDTEEHIEYMIKWTTHSLRNAVVAMLVTSLTTSAAFFANIASDVVAVKCFGLFAGSAIIINYLLMVTFFPCAVILHDRYFSKCMHSCCPCLCEKYPIPKNNNDNTGKLMITQKCENIISHVSKTLFHEFLPTIVYKFRYIFSILFLIIGVCGVVITFGKPGLNPPMTAEFQFFASTHSLEQYDLYLKKQFAYGLGDGKWDQYIEFVFGVELVDNGYKFNPDDTGTLVLKNGFNITSKQYWLRQFCKNFKSASFYGHSYTCDVIEHIFNSYTKPCPGRNTVCCNKSLPIPNKDFTECFTKIISSNPRNYVLIKDGNLKTFVIGVVTNYKYTLDFQLNKGIVKKLDDWTNQQMKNVSDSHKGWWKGQFIFYDLQNSLFEGTKSSLGIAVGVAFIVILATSLNVLLSIFSIITILFIISTTVGTLVLDGWYLNILESTVLSVAAGLSADFTLHYSVAYKSSLVKDSRRVRVNYGLSHIGPAVFMGAITTFVAGLVMLPSSVLSYTQFGTFLMVVMFFSWLYSTFFFLPVCAIFGPIGYFGQLTCAREESTQKSTVQMEELQRSPEEGTEIRT